MGTVEKLHSAAQDHRAGCTCTQAVFCAYAEEMGLSKETACRMMEGFCGGCGKMQELCGALAAASAVISFYCSDGQMENCHTRELTDRKVCEAAELFRKEYGGITCREILRGRAPEAAQCGMKVKDTILVIERVLQDIEHPRKEKIV